MEQMNLLKYVQPVNLKRKQVIHLKKSNFYRPLIPAIAYSQEKIDVYVAFNLKVSQQNFDEDEDITLEIYSVEELLEKIMKNEINDAKTVSAILTYYNKYCCNK